MILKYPHTRLSFTSKGNISGNCKRTRPVYEVRCDNCDKIFYDTVEIFEKRLKLINLEYCGKCSRPLMNAIAGYKGSHNEDGSIKQNKGHFSRERVDAMSEEEYKVFAEQRRVAAKGFHKKLEENPKLKEEHYRKIFKNSRIGYVSKAQTIIGDILKEDGFLVEQMIEGMWCDIVNYEKKIVIEYNGDLFHANPRIYKPDDYVDMIKMTAKEKWAKDRAKNFRLRGFGWQVIVIWENEWNNNREKVLTKLKTFKKKDWILPEWWKMDDVQKTVKVTKPNTKEITRIPMKELTKYIENGYIRMAYTQISKDDTNKQIPYWDKDKYIEDGWVLGRNNS